jgi:hypothetical protein
MADVGRTVPNTIGKAPITFAMIELAEVADCNSRKSTWLGYGFKDVTPEFGSQSTVPCLDNSMAAQGRQMLQEMASIDADWFMISGHHGSLYTSDAFAFMSGNNVDNAAWKNGQKYCGFFNESYHQGRWDWGSQSDPNSTNNPPPSNVNLDSLRANEIYVRTTDAAPASIAPQKQDNPFFDRGSGGSSPSPKGIIISACNTLAYKAARTTWNSYFPNAVVIGPVAKIGYGTWVTSAIASAQMTNESFWRDPQSILDQSGNCEKLQKQLAAGFPSSSKIGVLYKGTLYITGKSLAAGDDLTQGDMQ